MPFPPQSLTLHGGCNCGAIRYRINAPPLQERPTAPYHTAEATPEVVSSMPKIPCVLVDHCNDCRKATGGMVPMWIVTDVKTIDFSLLPASDTTRDQKDEDREWIPLESIADVHDSGNPLVSKSTLGRYPSSPDRYRWFCKNCGTPLAYIVTHAAYPEAFKAVGAPHMFDMYLGTLDREHLQNEWLRPDYALWCHFGIPWVKDLTSHGARRVVNEEGGHGGKVKTEPVPTSPLFMIDQKEGDDISVTLKAMGEI